MFECQIRNIETGEWDLIFSHNPKNPFEDNPAYDAELWEVWNAVYID